MYNLVYCKQLETNQCPMQRHGKEWLKVKRKSRKESDHKMTQILTLSCESLKADKGLKGNHSHNE